MGRRQWVIRLVDGLGGRYSQCVRPTRRACHSGLYKTGCCDFFPSKQNQSSIHEIMYAM